jgi:hypothetical protein
VALALVASLLVYLVNSASGQNLQRPELNNTGIWASSNAQRMVGRFAKAASALEFGLTVTATENSVADVDVLQDGNVAVAWDKTAGALYPVDALTAKIFKDRDLALPEQGALVAMGGGTLAVMALESGRIWATRTMDAASGLDLSPLATDSGEYVADLGAQANSAALAVGVDGAVHAVTSAGKAVKVPVAGDHFGVAEPYDVQKLETPQITAVGAESVILGADGTLLLGTQSAAVGQGAVLQQPSGAADHVYVATPTLLAKVSFRGEAVETVKGVSGKPIAPVVVAGCAFAVWGLDIVRDCGVPDDVRQLPEDQAQNKTFNDPVFRVNWGTVVLNDRESGTIYDWDLNVAIQEWSVFDNNEPEQEKNPEKKAEVRQDAKPVAQDDHLGVRKGRSGVLHVLDNDNDPNGSILSIIAVTQPTSKKGARVTISPDGQTLLFSQPTEGEQTTFTYTVSNDVDQASAKVTVEARDPSQLTENQGPKLRDPAPSAMSYAVGSLGSLPIAVATDYRDFDADPVTVSEAHVAGDAGGSVAITADGQIEYTAPETKNNKEVAVEFTVTDGRETQTGSVAIDIIGTSDKTGVKPQAQADAARGIVNEPITITPLANDIPGVDPSNPQARLKLAADVDPRSGLQVHTDRSSGIVTVTASKAGRYKLAYAISFGTAPRAQEGQIRVDVAKKIDDDLPVAMPDEVTVHGTSPANFDPLKNDFDPKGGMLSVVSAEPEDPDALSVAVWDKRWIRVEAEPDISGSQAITYQITNGDGRLVSGTAVVTQLPQVDKDEPLLRDDWVTARAGDSVLIPVLENDTTTGASTLSLLTNTVDGKAGQFEVIETSASAFDADKNDRGEAYAVGNQIRYVAPVAGQVTEDRQFRIVYYARTTSGHSAAGTVHVTVKPPLGEDDINSAPQPQTIEARVTLGEQVTIKVPSSQQDPDGDSVTLVKMEGSPSKGRVVEFTPEGIVYEAFLDAESAGTDSFQYVLADQYGKEGTGTVRVNIIAPGQTQPPLAVDDPLTAEPGVRVSIDVMNNDYISSDDTPQISLLDPEAEGVALVNERFVTLTVPAEGEPAATADYELKGNGDGSTVATVSVTGKEGYKNPPRVDDKVAVPGEKGRASVDLLEDAYDPDSDVTKTQITIPHETEEQGIVIQDGLVELNMSPLPQIVTFVATDESGAATSGIIYVPAKDDGFPYATGLIEIPANSTETFNVTDYVKSSRPNRTARITVSDLVRATPSHLSVEVDDSLDRFTLTSANDYTGPGAVTMQVTDGADVSDPEGKVATVSIPVQVGEVTPVLTCPEAEQVIRQGSEKTLDVRGLCHIWPANLNATLEYEWDRAIDNVSLDVTERGMLKLAANGNARPGDTGSITVRISGESAQSKLNVVVKAASPPKINPIVLEIKAGETASGTIKLSSPLTSGREDVILSCTASNKEAQSSQIPCKIDGKNWSVTPGEKFSGQLVYKLRVSDAGNTTLPGRQATTTLTINVYGVPGVPPDLHQTDGVQSNAVTMAWGPAAENGAPIDEYELQLQGGGSAKCPALSCTIKPLANRDEPYQFRVRAHNKAGWGEWSDWADGIADRIPDAPTGCVASDPLDKQITLSWLPVSGDYSKPWYVVRYSGEELSDIKTTTQVIKGLDNVQTTFEIWSENTVGRSETSCTAVGWPTGMPGEFYISSVSGDEDADSTPVEVEWTNSAPNGEGPVEYTLFHRKAGESAWTKVCSDVTATTCTTASIVLDGAVHEFKVESTNKPRKYTQTTPVATWYAEGMPPRPPAPDAESTGDNRMAKVSGHTPNSRGSAANSYVKIYSGDNLVGSATLSSWSYSKTVEAGANGATALMSIALCYKKASDGSEKCGPRSATKSVIPFGPMTLDMFNHRSPPNHGWSGWFQAQANANGRQATLTVTFDDDCEHKGRSYDENPKSDTGEGSLAVDLRCLYGGYERTRKVTVTLVSSATNPPRPTLTYTENVTSAEEKSVSFSDKTVTYDGSKVSVFVLAHGGGGKIKVTLSADGCDPPAEQTTTNQTTKEGLTLTCDIGWNATKTFTAHIDDLSDDPDRHIPDDWSFTVSTGPEPDP